MCNPIVLTNASWVLELITVLPSLVNIANGTPDAQLLISFGENFPSTRSNHSHRGGVPAAIPLVRKMIPSGSLTLAGNTTLKSKVCKIKVEHI